MSLITNSFIANDFRVPASDDNPTLGVLNFDLNNSVLLRDRLRGETTEHADPPRLEDEGQSGG
jgi:hypothetical protein